MKVANTVREGAVGKALSLSGRSLAASNSVSLGSGGSATMATGLPSRTSVAAGALPASSPRQQQRLAIFLGMVPP